ncbi:hypothetical protein [Brevundimonas vancanneytii]|uniref:hypothetical protein n=1 Tax=Brevundimonas vancanneytii TaxID=1325724 RepID=UPI0010FE2D7D|nr:hypothetical protein [Brevundimonas vancanneytii]
MSEQAPNPTPSPAPGTPAASSPGGEPPADPNAPPAEGAPETPPETPPEPTPEEAAAAARAAVPEAADGYAVNLSDDARERLGLTDGDPLVAELSKFAHAQGKPQGWLDDVMEGAAALAEAGLFDGGFDPAAEAASLGENAEGRRREVELFAESLKSRGEIDDGMFGELMSLSPTANGVKLIEKMRSLMGQNGMIPTPSGAEPNGADALKAKALEMAKDPKYGRDRQFTAEANAAWAQAYPGAR